MAKPVNTIDLLGEENAGKALIERTLTEFIDDVVTLIGERAFWGTKSLKKVDLANVSGFQANAFRDCSVLKTLILRGKTVCSLSDVNVLKGTPFATAGSGATLYVPQELVEDYKNATNWSSLYLAGKCNIVAIEGSEYE